MSTAIGVVGGAFSYGVPFQQHGGVHTIATVQDVYDVKPDVLVFTGGEDVDPYLYDEHPHPTTYYNVRRDAKESEIFAAGQEIGAKSAGICRGAQFLTVMNGGKLVQNIHGHACAHTHPLRTLGGEQLTHITSTHHQMMYPYCLDDASYEVIAIGDTHGAMEGVPAGYSQPDHVVEAVWYPTTQCLCVQGHPEYMPQDSDGWQWYQSLLKNYIFN